MDEKRLAEIDEWATDHVPRCYGCDGIARVIVPGTSRPMCAACAPNVPGAVLPLVSVYATTLDLAAQVRRLTAALATVTAERDVLEDGAESVRLALVDVVRHITADPCDSDEALATPTARLVAVIDESADELRATIDRACEERDHARTALATARREGAEGMREVVKAEIHAAFHYNDPPDDGVERPIGPVPGQWEAHQTLRKLLSRVCAVITDGGAS